MRLAGHVNNPQRRTGHIDGFGGLKLANDDGDQVGAHRDGVVERDGRATVCCSYP